MRRKLIKQAFEQILAQDKISALKIFNVLNELRGYTGQWFWEEINKEQFFFNFEIGMKSLAKIVTDINDKS